MKTSFKNQYFFIYYIFFWDINNNYVSIPLNNALNFLHPSYLFSFSVLTFYQENIQIKYISHNSGVLGFWGDRKSVV